MAELHRKIYSLSSPRIPSASLMYGTSNTTNNNRSIKTSSSSYKNTTSNSPITPSTANSLNHSRVPPTSMTTATTTTTSSQYNELNLVDDDDDLDPPPPALSSYAISLLQNDENPIPVVNRSRKNSSSAYDRISNTTRPSYGYLNYEVEKNSDSIYSNHSIGHTHLSNTYNNNNNNNNSGLSISRQDPDLMFESHSNNNARSSRHSFRFMSKVGLGAPRRLTEDEFTTHQGGVTTTTNDDVKTSYSTSVFTNNSVRNTTAFSTHKYDNVTASNSNSYNSNSGTSNSRKHQLTATPIHERVASVTGTNNNYSPLHKRNNNNPTPYKRKPALAMNQAAIESRYESTSSQPQRTPHNQLLQQQIQRTPTPKKNDELDMYATPEQARRALTPLSHSKNNIRFDIFADQRNNKENTPIIPTQVSHSIPRKQKRNDLVSYDQEHFKSILAKELQAQKEQILKEVKQEQAQTIKKEQEKVIEKKEKAEKSNSSNTTNIISINNQEYECLELIGKGGSSKVYKARAVQGPNKKTYAVKIVTFDQHDDTAVVGFKGEIGILKKLKNVDRAVQLFDYSLKSGLLMVVLECGEIDLAHVLSARLSQPLDTSFVRYHVTEMMKCVKAVHDMGIVHSDLKPANFLFVKGVLKLIDFGISNTLSDQTMNIYRECQIGTPNYMAPETLIEANQTLRLPTTTTTDDDFHSGTWKVGKPADIWSCGCIIYQMVYGKPPYAQYSGSKKILAITNPKIEVSYPRTNPKCGTRINGLIIDLIKGCLNRDVKNRCTADDVLNMPFLNPKLMTQKFMDDLVRNAVKYGCTHPEISDKRLDTLVNDVWKRVNEYS